MKTYTVDKCNHLAMLGTRSDEKYWEKLWADSDDDLIRIVNSYKNAFILNLVKKYAKEDDLILEAGCGRAQYVYWLSELGYNVMGIDNEDKVIQQINRVFPNLEVQHGDIENIDDFFIKKINVYISLGVIEHSIYGYRKALLEMDKCLTDNGYVFLSVPYISPLRRLKKAIGSYPRMSIKEIMDSENVFFQYLIDHKELESELKKLNFNIVERHPRGVKNGLGREVKVLRYLFKIIYGDGIIEKSSFGSILQGAFEKILRPICSNSIIIIAKKEKML